MLFELIIFTVQCASFTEPDSGSVTIATNGVQTVATYSCEDGYTLIGQSESVCQSDGQLSEEGQVCGTPLYAFRSNFVQQKLHMWYRRE